MLVPLAPPFAAGSLASSCPLGYTAVPCLRLHAWWPELVDRAVMPPGPLVAQPFHSSSAHGQPHCDQTAQSKVAVRREGGCLESKSQSRGDGLTWVQTPALPRPLISLSSCRLSLD